MSDDTYNKLPDPADFVEDVIRNGGGVVLLHDIHRGEEKMEFVLKTTALLITRARESGLSIKLFGSILSRRPQLFLLNLRGCGRFSTALKIMVRSKESS